MKYDHQANQTSEQSLNLEFVAMRESEHPNNEIEVEKKYEDSFLVKFETSAFHCFSFWF